MLEGRGEIVVYRRKGASEVQLRAVGGTVWLSQWGLADLYATSVPNIKQIISRVIADGEMTEATINSELIVRQEGSRQVRRQREYDESWELEASDIAELLAIEDARNAGRKDDTGLTQQAVDADVR